MLTRRQLLSGALATGAGAAAFAGLGRRGAHDAALAAALPTGVAFDPAPFTLGVSSGDPTPDSVILQTRLAPEPLTGGGLGEQTVDVDWVVAEDPRLRRIVAQGTAVAGPTSGHAVHVNATGLAAGRTYWYRFAAFGRTSRIGRTRTAPVDSPSRLRLAFVSCQNFEAGQWAAYRRLVAEDVDLVVHLGDYMYENGGDGVGRSHTGDEVSTVESYRNRYALYQGDPALRAAHAAFPFVVTWDDHEVDNNYADLIPESSDGPGQESEAAFAQRRANAYQAFYEHLPIRLTETGPPDGPDFRIYRRLQFGDLLDMSVLDTRQYRSDQPCQVPDGDQGQELFFVAGCPEQDAPTQTIMGEAQRDWLKDGLSASTAKWRCIAQQLIVAETAMVSTNALTLGLPTGAGRYFGTDAWDGYRVERADLLAHLAEREIPDTFVITGDIHSHWVHDLKPDFSQPDSPVVATEFVGSSISSTGYGGLTPIVRPEYYLNNPHLRYFEGSLHGYAIVDVTPDAVTCTYRSVGDNGQIADPNRPVTTLAEFRLARGNPLVEQVAGTDGNPR